MSIRNDLDVDFKFPEPQELTIRLKDVLEPRVDEKYYLSDEQVSKIRLWEDRQKENGRGFRFNTHDGDDIATTMTTSADRPSTSNYYKDPSGVAIRTANRQGYDMATNGDGVDLSYPQSKTKRGRVGHGVSKTLMGADCMGTIDNYRIRKLTPKECWRLMSFDDEDFDKAKASGVSDSQLYRQAGNSIVVNVLEGVLSNLLAGNK